MYIYIYMCECVCVHVNQLHSYIKQQTTKNSSKLNKYVWEFQQKIVKNMNTHKYKYNMKQI
jgi:hypothetical protein